MFIFNFNVVLFCHPAPELSPVSLTKLGLCRGTEEKQAFSQFLKKVVVENGFLRALADMQESKRLERLFCPVHVHVGGIERDRSMIYKT